ncbi:hypothetical protein A946_04395 [Methylacidiphilum kamchatkense Kam1]|uniref:Uncharacterized protein n=1 Tax=Methylacidiphilum kamchatkense Kam1 TaxID=1202785 RepID=A0ABR4ZX79_9BACT|nr:hypothetical protein A946_04395 [Methylacidiphilum kamchatkense Kam1]
MNLLIKKDSKSSGDIIKSKPPDNDKKKNKYKNKNRKFHGFIKYYYVSILFYFVNVSKKYRGFFFLFVPEFFKK